MKRNIVIEVEYDLGDIPIGMITSIHTVKAIIEKDMCDYFSQSEGFSGLSVKVQDLK